jgi:RNA 2',3'-cyclic 3'-phosphodiesterase
MFAAVPVPDEVVEAVTARLAVVPDPPVRWVPAEQMHVTLAFYRHVPGERVDDLATRLRRAAARHRPLRLALGNPGTFGSARAARVLFLRLHGDVRELRALAASARAAGRRIGLSGDELAADHRYRPHLTLARARPPADLRATLATLDGAAPLGWTAESACLVRSELGHGPGGTARHTVVADLPFRPADVPG